jgi:hypothetical protein
VLDSSNRMVGWLTHRGVLRAYRDRTTRSAGPDRTGLAGPTDAERSEAPESERTAGRARPVDLGRLGYPRPLIRSTRRSRKRSLSIPCAAWQLGVHAVVRRRSTWVRPREGSGPVSITTPQ